MKTTWVHTAVKTASGIKPEERDGAKAYDADVSLRSNPHAPHTLSFERWAQGWVQAAAEDMVL